MGRISEGVLRGRAAAYRAGKKLGFLEKVFRFLGFLGFLGFNVQRQPDKNLPSRKNILDPINHSPCHFVLYKL